MKQIVIYHHLGLGDHIICNGMVRHFAESTNVSVLCKMRYRDSVWAMFRDDPQIQVLPVEDDDVARKVYDQLTRNHGYEGMLIGAPGPGGFQSPIFDQEFYRQAGIPFEYRWSKFHVPEHPDPLPVPPKPYIFVHDDPSRYFIIHGPQTAQYTGTVRPRDAGSITRWLPILREAQEIHVIPSSFLCLVDSIELNETMNRVCYKSARPGGDVPQLKREWTIV